MAASAQQITGIVVSEFMLVNVESDVHKLMTWIEGFPIVILVAHSGRRYHFPVLISTLTRLDVILRFFGCVKDYIDSIQVLMKVFPYKHPTNVYNEYFYSHMFYP